MDFFHKLAGDLVNDRCEQLKHPSYLNLALSIFILLGILVSYLPQHYRIISRKTSEGISPYFVLLGTTSGTSAFANICVLPASRADVACCKTVSAFDCGAGLLGIAQVGVQWFCFAVILLLFLVFFPRHPTLPNNIDKSQYTWKTAATVAFVCLLHGLLVIFISASLTLARPHDLGQWANALGIMATILAAIQYFPQIWMTWHLGHVGSLSIPMMLIQTPGSFVWSGSLFARLGLEGWSSWGVFLVTGCLQGVLLAMCICFEIRDRRARDAEHDDSIPTEAVAPNGRPLDDERALEADDERMPLINGSKKSPKKASSKASKKSSRSKSPAKSSQNLDG